MLTPTFLTDGEKRNAYLDNIENLPNIIKQRHKYIWIAFLKDGSEITQIDSKGKEYLFKEVLDAQEAGELDSVFWIPTTEGKDAIGVRPSEGERIVLFRRNALSMGGKHKGIIYGVGVQKTIKKKNEKMIRFIDSDGNTLDSNDEGSNYVKKTKLGGED